MESQVSIALQPRVSTVRIVAPEGTDIFLDGDRIEDSAAALLEIAPGSHTITMKVGDYSLSRPFDILPGGELTLSLEMDIAVDTR